MLALKFWIVVQRTDRVILYELVLYEKWIPSLFAVFSGKLFVRFEERFKIDEREVISG